jgi:hypothetical protein
MVETAPGPIDVLVIEFPEGSSGAESAAALGQLLDQGAVCLYDIVAVRRAEDGTVSQLSLDDPAAASAFAAFGGARSGLLDDEDVAHAGAILEPGMSGLMVAYENAWARGFVTAAHGEGARVIASERIPAQVLLDALDAIDGEG